MNNEIYRELVRPFDATKDIDGAPIVYVTQENNGHAVFYNDDNTGTLLVKYFVHEDSSKVIRWAIEYIDGRRIS